MDGFYTYPNRTICDVLEEMRKLNKTRNYSALAGLIEEIQSMANKMEAALGDKKDVKLWTKKRASLKEEIKKLIKIKEGLDENNNSDNRTDDN